MNTTIDGSRVAFLVADGVEQDDLTATWDAVERAGGIPVVVSPERGRVQSMRGDQTRDTFAVDEQASEADAADFVALVVPGGVMSADKLRADAAAIAFTMAFAAQHKPVAAVCHAPWLLIEAGIAEGREVTSYPSLRTDLENAGAIWSTSMVVVDGLVVTSRRADEQFARRLLEVIRQSKLQSASSDKVARAGGPGG